MARISKSLMKILMCFQLYGVFFSHSAVVEWLLGCLYYAFCRAAPRTAVLTDLYRKGR